MSEKKIKRAKKPRRSNEEKRTQSAIEGLFRRAGIVMNRVNSGAFTGATGVRVRCNSIQGKADLEAWVAMKPTDKTRKVSPIGLCAYIEVKSSTGRQNPNQKKFQALMEATSQKYMVVRSLQETVEKMVEWKAELKKDFPDFDLDIGKLDRYAFKA